MSLFGTYFANFIEFTKYWMKKFPDFKQSNEFSCIDYASREGNFETVNFLINSVINVNEESCFLSINYVFQCFQV